MFFVKKEAGSDELPFQILLQGMDFPDGEPVILIPPGLSLQRQQYLYKNIRPFVDDQKYWRNGHRGELGLGAN